MEGRMSRLDDLSSCLFPFRQDTTLVGSWSKTPAWSGGLAAAANDVGEERYGRGVGNAEPGAEVIPEGNAELLAGLTEAEEGVAAGATEVAVGAAADMALGHLAAQRGLRAVGMQRNF